MPRGHTVVFVFTVLKEKNITRSLEFITVDHLWYFPLCPNLVLMKKGLCASTILLALFKSKVYQVDWQVWGIGVLLLQLPNS